jgi:enoyl-CoA hydratase
MTSPAYFDTEHDDATGVTRLTLSRPERLNTMDPGFFPALRDSVRQLDDTGRTRALVIGSSGKHFSAGMALDVFAGAGMPMLDLSTARKRQAFQTGLRRLMACFDALDEARFPVICAVQGGCIGGALDLAASPCRRSTSAWPPTWARFNACPRSCPKAWRGRWPTRASGSTPNAPWPRAW